jgi:hypothetical protein
VVRSLLFVAVVAAPAFGQPARDGVTYFDRKEGKVVAVADAAITKESPAGIEFRTKGEMRTAAAPDVVRVDYGNLPGVSVSDLIALRQLEEADDLAKLQAKYADLAKKATGRAKRVLAYREGMTAARSADRRTDPAAFRPDADRAAGLLTEFAARAEPSWEVWPAARTAARLRMELGDFAGAAAVLGRLAAVPGLPAELRHEAKLAEAGAAQRAGSASGLLDALQKDATFPAAGPLRQRLTVLTAEPAALEGAIAAADDPVARAVGYGRLGDWHSASGRPADARWAYLWVVTVYPQDRDERVVALHKLAATFDSLGDAERAARFRSDLPAAR